MYITSQFSRVLFGKAPFSSVRDANPLPVERELICGGSATLSMGINSVSVVSKLMIATEFPPQSVILINTDNMTITCDGIPIVGNIKGAMFDLIPGHARIRYKNDSQGATGSRTLSVKVTYTDRYF